MCQLSIVNSQLVAGRVVIASISPLDRYRALVAMGTKENIAAAVVAGLITIKTA